MKRFQQAVAYDGAYNMAAFSYEDSTPNAQQPQKQYNPDSFGQQDSRVMPGTYITVMIDCYSDVIYKSYVCVCVCVHAGGWEEDILETKMSRKLIGI